MKRFLLFCGLLASAQFVMGQSVMSFDQGIEEGRGWNRGVDLNVNQMGCSSLVTDFWGHEVVRHGSLCSPQNVFFATGFNAAVYKNHPRYRLFSPEGLLLVDDKPDVVFGRNGIHGNLVVNAVYDFDPDMEQRPWQVFGIYRKAVTHDLIWVTRHVAGSGQPGGEFAETLIKAVQHIVHDSGGVHDTSSPVYRLGALNISFGIHNDQIAEDFCDEGVLQDEVNELYDLGIVTTVGFANEDIPSDKRSWPSCLENVINVGGVTAKADPDRGIGIGADKLHFFAKDKSDQGFAGNSFAAPRVAAAYAKLHEVFPTSSVNQKTQALINASNKMYTYNQRLVNGTLKPVRERHIEKNQMADAIEALRALMPPDDPVSGELNIVSAPNGVGPLYGGAEEKFELEFVFDRS